MKRLIIIIAALMLLPLPALAGNIITGTAGSRIETHVLAEFNHPWAMSFLDDERLLITTRTGRLWLYSTREKTRTEVSGIPQVHAGGQGGLGDILPHPDFEKNGLIYLSFVDSMDGGRTRFAAVIRAELSMQAAPRLVNAERIWRQMPASAGKGHFSHRLAFGPEGSPYKGQLFITSGDRQLLEPAQGFDNALGKIIRLNDDGSIPGDNPFRGKGELASSFWSMGHRNALGIAFDGQGRLWASEMGPKHGDELNLIEKGANYGWPLVSEGDHYSGRSIPAHDTRPEFVPPEVFWVPTIAPSSLMFSDGEEFPAWQGDAFIGGLRSRSLIRIDMGQGGPREAERFALPARIREVEQGPGGEIWVLEDGASARLIRFTNPG